MADEHAERAFTTFEVSRLCGVLHATVAHWINKGKIKAYTTPDKHRRVDRSELVAFMHAYELPIPSDLEPAPRRILIIDDDPAITRLLERSWDHDGDGYAVLAVNNPVAGLVEVGRHQPDVLILDLLMPILSGYEVCRILKAGPATRHIRVIAISGGAPSDAQLDFILANADMFLPKPFDPRRLVGAVDLLLGAR
ncbi:MAG: response regulator [Elusimicrobia bacterium]|nr:response regulator [Elusimicrobiota bacterium]MDE2510330.1 response regulator [Elusimicrobiota bacterium]